MLLFVGVESLGVPFPGETMLITASVYAGVTHRLVISGVVAAAVAGAVIGDNIGFVIGWFGGYPMLRRYGRFIRLDEPRLKVGRYIFMRQGARIVFFGRFVAILRTYAALLAGTNRMDWRRFLAYNAAGGAVWASLYGAVSYLLGQQIDRLSRPTDIAFGIAGLLALAAGAVFVRRHARRLEAAAERALPGPLDSHLPRAGS